jgi:hypothetical protein
VLVGSLECGYESERPDRDQALGLEAPWRPEARLRGAPSGSSASSETESSDDSSERDSLDGASSSSDSSCSTSRAEEGGLDGGASDDVEYAPLRADLPF